MKIRRSYVCLLIVLVMLLVAGCGGGNGQLEQAKKLAAGISEEFKDVKKAGVMYNQEKKEYIVTIIIYKYLNKEQIAATAGRVRDKFMKILDAENQGISVTVYAVYEDGKKVGKAFYDARYRRLNQTYLGDS